MNSFKEDLVGVSNSILKVYGLPCFNPTSYQFDELLRKANVPYKRKLAVLLLDGFGAAIQEEQKEYAPFIYEHKAFEVSSVFPPTTAAATTALISGQYPIQNGWLGWLTKLPMYSLPEVMFNSTFVDSGLCSPIKVNEYLPTTDIINLINNKSKGYKAGRVMGFMLQPQTLNNFLEVSQNMVASKDFSYLYWTDPDYSLHEYGTKSTEVHSVCHYLDKMVRELVSSNPDTLFITLADHGHIDTTYMNICDYPDFMDCLSVPANCLEARAGMFFIKKGKEEQFRNISNKYFGEKFEILSKEEVINKHIFGPYEPDEKIKQLLGDFLFIAKDNVGLLDHYTSSLVSHHAGSTSREKRIAVGVYNL